MPRVLLVKTSSLGDVVHNLPVVSDVSASLPSAQIDWVVEEAFEAIPRLHPRVQRVIPVAIRRWRASLLSGDARKEMGRFVERLREQTYDVVIDTQGLFKSAVIARVARGRRFGLDWKSSREPLFPFYDRTFAIPRSAHAVERNRTLAARALAYTPGAHVDYGIAAKRVRPAWLPADYAIFVHGTSAREKLWDEAAWIALGRALVKRGVLPVLPWGNDRERERSGRLAQEISGLVVPQRLALGDLACVLAGARVVIGVDTGLTHLAGALGVATVGIYIATAPAQTGLYGCTRGVNVGGVSMSPSLEDVLAAIDRVS
ncbi:MAG: lipopolysaccharide heptosyltransferase I [Burkholderiales bacterium]